MNINTDNSIIEIPFETNNFLSTSKIVKMEGPLMEVKFLQMDDRDTKSIEGFGECHLSVKSQVIKADTYEVSGQMPIFNKKSITNEFGIDMDAQLFSVLKNESNLLMHRNLKRIYQEAGERSNKKRLNRWQSFLNRKFKLEFPEWVDEKGLSKRLILLSNLIATTSRRGPANFCVTNSKLALFLQEGPAFAFIDSGAVTPSSGVRPLGSIADRIEVYLDPSMKFDDNLIIIGRKTHQDDSGVIFGQYNRSLMKVITEYNFEEKTMLRDRYAMDSIGSSDSLFLTVRIELRKKPFWRKLIGA